MFSMGSVIEPKITASEIRRLRIRFVIVSLWSLSSLFRGTGCKKRLDVRFLSIEQHAEAAPASAAWAMTVKAVPTAW
jgi:hypothetical protein